MRLLKNTIICLMMALLFQVKAQQIPVNISIDFSEKQGVMLLIAELSDIEK